MSLTVAAHTAMLNAFAGMVKEVSLHKGHPGVTGVSEATGWQYKRQPITWFVTDRATNTNRIAFEVGPGEYTHIGYWTAGGTFWGSRACTSRRFNTEGVYEVAPGDWVEELL